MSETNEQRVTFAFEKAVALLRTPQSIYHGRLLPNQILNLQQNVSVKIVNGKNKACSNI
jgi:hypothetical protein